jgi:hypothetical protein
MSATVAEIAVAVKMFFDTGPNRAQEERRMSDRSKVEPDFEGGATHDPARPVPTTPAEAATERLRARQRQSEQQRRAVDQRRYGNDQRAGVYAQGDRQRALDLATGRVIAGQATRADVHRLGRAALNSEFERQHADLLQDDRAFEIAHRFAETFLQDPVYASATAEQLSEVVAQATRRELDATSPAPVSQTVEARSRYVDEMRAARAQGTTPTRGRGLRTFGK